MRILKELREGDFVSADSTRVTGANRVRADSKEVRDELLLSGDVSPAGLLVAARITGRLEATLGETGKKIALRR